MLGVTPQYTVTLSDRSVVVTASDSPIPDCRSPFESNAILSRLTVATVSLIVFRESIIMELLEWVVTTLTASQRVGQSLGLLPKSSRRF
jgi:hypothetical protein